MGKSLIIKGADFSANGIAERKDITSLLSTYFFAKRSLGRFSGSTAVNAARCCVFPFTFSAIGIDISQFSKIEVNIKSGYDYVFGTGPQPSNNDTGWQGWDGNVGGQAFAWVTANQQGVATIDSTVLAMSLNLRHDDNTTPFADTTVLTDIVDSVVLIP